MNISPSSHNKRSPAGLDIRTAAASATRPTIPILGRLRSFRLRTVLVVPFIIPIIVSTGLVGWISFRNGQRAISDLAFQLQSETSSRVRQYLDGYLATPHQLNQINLDAWRIGLLDLRDFQRTGQYFFKQMQVFDVGYVSFGNPQGEFIGVERLDNGQLLINEVSQQYKLGKLRVYETSREGERTKLVEVKDWDPRSEEWYSEPVRVGKSVWSPVYQWEDKPDVISLSSSYLVRDTDNQIVGVLSIDLILTQIGTFLEKLEIGQSGKAFILARDGFLVANSGSSKPTQVINGQASRVKGWESADGVIRATSQQLIKQYSDLRQISDGRQFSFEIGNQRQLVKATPWRDPLGLDWLTVVVVPEGDFMTQINANKHTTILLCLFTFAAATAIGALTARWISGQIGELNSAARGIASGDLNQRVETSGIVGIVEIGILAASFNEMTRQLKESIKNLKETTAAKERIESELKIAHDIQMSMIPKVFPPFPNRREFDIYATIVPAREVGGDFYDFFFIDEDHLCLAIGDVSGKGVPAALSMAVTKTLFKATAGKVSSPDGILFRLNQEICRDNESCMFVTVFCAVLSIHTGRLEYSNGGHNLPYLLYPNGIKPLENTGGVALGVMEEARYHARGIVLEAGSGLFLYTDGVTESVDGGGKLFSEHRLEHFLARVNGSSPTEIIQGAVAEVRGFSAGVPQSDDITLLALRYLGEQGHRM